MNAGTASATRFDRTKLMPNAITVAEYVMDRYPQVPQIDGYRLDPLPDHPSGHAIDIMVYDDQALGTQILDDLLSSDLPIRYTIWQQQVRRPNGTGYLMQSRHNPRLDHFDHIHVTVF